MNISVSLSGSILRDGRKAEKGGEFSMKGITDIHMHLIPGVDDGAFNIEMSKSMMAMAWLQGVETIFATPHSSAFLWDQSLVRENYRLLEEAAASSPMGQRLCLGCEVYCLPSQMDETLKDLETGRIPAMNKTRYVLTEFSVKVQPWEGLQMASRLLGEGWLPILAHVERYPRLFEGNTLEQLQALGCRFQINAYSLEEQEGEVSERARKLIREEKVSFLGSDAHRMNCRPPSVAKGVEYIFQNCRKEYAEAVVFDNAEKYLINQNA